MVEPHMKRCLAGIFQMGVAEWLNPEPVYLSEIRAIVLKKSDIQSEQVCSSVALTLRPGLNHLTRLQTRKGCAAPVGCVLEKSNILCSEVRTSTGLYPG